MVEKCLEKVVLVPYKNIISPNQFACQAQKNRRILLRLFLRQIKRLLNIPRASKASRITAWNNICWRTFIYPSSMVVSFILPTPPLINVRCVIKVFVCPASATKNGIISRAISAQITLVIICSDDSVHWPFGMAFKSTCNSRSSSSIHVTIYWLVDWCINHECLRCITWFSLSRNCIEITIICHNCTVAITDCRCSGGG